MIMFSIYYRPADHPRHTVIREWRIPSNTAAPAEPVAGELWLCDSVEEARSVLPPGLHLVPAASSDVQSLVESWL